MIPLSRSSSSFIDPKKSVRWIDQWKSYVRYVLFYSSYLNRRSRSRLLSLFFFFRKSDKNHVRPKAFRAAALTTRSFNFCQSKLLFNLWNSSSLFSIYVTLNWLSFKFVGRPGGGGRGACSNRPFLRPLFFFFLRNPKSGEQGRFLSN